MFLQRIGCGFSFAFILMQGALKTTETSIRHVIPHESSTQRKNVAPNTSVELRMRHRSVRFPCDDVIVANCRACTVYINFFGDV